MKPPWGPSPRQEQEQKAVPGLAIQTMGLPNKAYFQAMTKLSSTPYTGEPFHREQDKMYSRRNPQCNAL